MRSDLCRECLTCAHVKAIKRSYAPNNNVSYIDENATVICIFHEVALPVPSTTDYLVCADYEGRVDGPGFRHRFLEEGILYRYKSMYDSTLVQVFPIDSLRKVKDAI